MNQVLQNRFNELGAGELQQLKYRLQASPRALRLLELLDRRRERKINTFDAVDYLYKDTPGETFEILRNRFFKLRKQLLGLMRASETGTKSGVQLLPLEEKLFRCRQLIAENHFQVARNELRELVNECRQQNIFELLPESISQLIYCNMAMNVLKENEKLTDELSAASLLLTDFRQMQVLSRKAYLCMHSRNYKRVLEIMQQMRRVTIRRSAFPRFKLFYHFVVLNHTSARPGVSTKSAARHLSSLKNLVAKFPAMPAGYYEPHAAAIMQFYIKIGEGTQNYMKGNTQVCYRLFKEAWEIQERIPNLRVRRSESHFSNRIAIEVATGRYRDALKTAESLIEFQKEQRQEEKRLKGYAEIAVIYSYAWPSIKCPDPEFISGQLKAYTAMLKKSGSQAYGDALSTQAIFYFFSKDFKAAKKISSIPAARQVFDLLDLGIYNRVLALNPSAKKAVIGEIKRDCAKQLHAAVSSDRIFSLKRVQQMLVLLETTEK
jgi:hypothetical protein